ncbi:outer membrane receptor protein involved in Fe transport [Sphingomonas endophytica]|uniref:Outer membrane receptor protein involved in Fe transport n=1 Tax=Sphingomonas endophytica TaxID=869719 RepID=A0A7X0JAZ7_9SPHN|nr:TonB-dependent receptor [Sphingomonas endophytica]MBB6503904.1 outer membrane receptor protein involved in Fe transport [Sphingomonas endophytica]
MGFLSHSVSVSALAGAMLLAAPAVAQQAAPGDSDAATQRAAAIASEPVETPAATGEVVVTGSRIQRPNVASAAPITSVTAQDIRAQAPLNVEEVLNRLPQVAPDSQQNYQDSDGRQRIKLRSLGFERTLVLIDGKRLGTQNGQDTGIIPPSLLERVDVLTGGASSVYGSDAVAGVVNFILRPSFDGIRLDANYSFYNHQNKGTTAGDAARGAGITPLRGLTNDGGRSDLTLTAGKKLFDDKLSLMGFVNYRQANFVPYNARSTSACEVQQPVADGPLSCTTTTYAPGGYVRPAVTGGPEYINNPDGTRSFVPFGQSNAAFDRRGYPLQRDMERVNAGGFATLTLAPEAELYGSAIWFKDTSYNRYPTRVLNSGTYGSAPYQVNCDNPFLSGSQAAALCGAATGTSALAPIDVGYRFDNLPYTLDEYVNRGIRATAGVRGKVGTAWTYDVGGVFARNQQDVAFGDIPDVTRVNNSLNVVNVNGTPTCASVVNGTDPNCIPFDAFSAGNDGSVMSYLLAGNRARTRGVGTLWDVTANMTGDLGDYGVTSPFANDGVAIALGAEYRKDSYRSTANGAYRALYSGTDFDASQDVWESNIEVQAPLVQEKPFAHLLQANGGYRVSKYSSSPDTFSTWKLEGLWAPVRDLTLRASFNKAQRAPTVIEIRQATNIGFSRQGGARGDFCAPTRNTDGSLGAPVASLDVCRATGLSDALYGSPTLLCPDNSCTIRSGGFNADPETAYTQTYGFVARPRFVPGLTFSVDYYRIKIDNSLGYNDDNYYLDGCLRSGGDPFFCSGIVRDASGTLYAAAGSNPTSGFIRAGTTNYYRSIARGLDFQAQYTLDAGGAGRFDWGFTGSLTTFAGGQDSPIQPERNCAGYYGNGCGQLIPKWSHGLRTTWTSVDKAFNASLNWRHVGSLTNANNSGDAAIGGTPDREQATYYRIGAQDYFDLALTFNVTQQVALRLIANNLLDRVAPFVPNSYNISLARNNTIPQRYDPLGRQIVVGATVNF